MFVVVVFFLLGTGHAQARAYKPEFFSMTVGQENLDVPIQESTKQFSITIPATALDEAVTIRLEHYPDFIPVPSTLHVASDMWVYDVVRTDTTVAGPVKLKHPIAINVRATKNFDVGKKMYFWDFGQKAWRPLRTLASTDTVIHARTVMPYGIIAAFDDPKIVIGKGSWFHHKLPDTAASNDFPVGSRLLVTDLETNKRVEVTVRSTGPFVPGRVIDLARGAFKQIHRLQAGIAHLRVELLKTA